MLPTTEPEQNQSTITTTSVAELKQAPPDRGRVFESDVVLSEIGWDEYVSLRDKPGNNGLRITFADGELEIMTLSSFHELISFLIHDFIHEWRVARNIAALPPGSMTLRHQMLKHGLEGDLSYYIQNDAMVRAIEEIDLESGPPPDLAVEVEHKSTAIRTMPIYARLGVPEVLRWRDETLTIQQLGNGEYTEREEIEALPGFPFDQLRQAPQQGTKVDETTLVREIRKWLEANLRE